MYVYYAFSPMECDFDMLGFWIGGFQGRTSNRGLARFSTLGEVSTATTTAAKPSWSPLGGLFGWLTGGRSRSMPPLDFPLEGVKFPPALPDYVQSEKPKITTLPNGVKIASVKSEVWMGVYGNAFFSEFLVWLFFDLFPWKGALRI